MGVRGLKEHEEVARGSEAALPQGLVTSPVFNPGPSCVCAESISAPPPPEVTPRPLPRVMVQDQPLHSRAAMRLVWTASSVESPIPPPHESCWEEHIVFSWLVWLLSIFKELASTPTFPCFYGKSDSSEPARAGGYREESGTREAWALPGWGVWSPVPGAWCPHPVPAPTPRSRPQAPLPQVSALTTADSLTKTPSGVTWRKPRVSALSCGHTVVSLPAELPHGTTHDWAPHSALVG